MMLYFFMALPRTAIGLGPFLIVRTVDVNDRILLIIQVKQDAGFVLSGEWCFCQYTAMKKLLIDKAMKICYKITVRPTPTSSCPCLADMWAIYAQGFVGNEVSVRFFVKGCHLLPFSLHICLGVVEHLNII